MGDFHPAYSLYLLGHPRAECGGRPVKFETRKAVGLLAYIALHEKPVPRESLAALFWPDFDQERAPANLRRTLSSLTATFAPRDEGTLPRSTRPTLLDAGRNCVGISPDAGLLVDVLEFERLAGRCLTESAEETRRGDLARALGLYRSEFLDGFGLEDSVDFDDWQEQRREALHQLFLRLLEASFLAERENRDWDAARDLARRWIAADDLEQRAHRALMLSLAAAGQRGAALRHYDECVRILASRLGTRPDPETDALRKKIAEGGPPFAAVQEPASPDPPPGPLPFLKAKLHAPPLKPRRVPRQRLVELLENSIQAPLTLVSAPAGYGKTSLLAEWAATTAKKVAWISLESGDDEPMRFLGLLIESLRSAEGRFWGEAASVLRSPVPIPPESILASVLNEASGLAEALVLVLDDFQNLESPASLRLVLYLLERLPPGLRVILASRADPSLPLARLRAREGIAEIRALDLRFSERETEAFLGGVMGLRLSPEESQVVGSRVEGWAAGLQLAGLSLRDSALSGTATALTGRLDGFLEGSKGRFLFDFLIEEVLSHLSADTRARLIRYAILEQVCGSLCDAVWGEGGGGQFLEEACKSNLFLSPLDDEGCWFRFHALFRDLLLHRLSAEVPAEETRELHLRAGRWLEREGRPEEAMRHLFAAGDLPAVANVLSRSAPLAFARGEGAAVLKWIDTLPAELLASRFDLGIHKAYALALQGRFGDLASLLETWEAAVPKLGDPALARIMEGGIALGRAALHDIAGETDQALECALRARDSAEGLLVAQRRTILHLLLRSYRMLGAWELAEEAYAECARAAAQAKDIFSYAVGAFDQASMMTLRGQLGRAERLYEAVFDFARSLGAESFASLSEAYAGLAEVKRERGELREALRLCEEAEKRVRLWNFPTDLVIVHLVHLRVSIDLGRLDEARDHCRSIEEILDRGQTYRFARTVLEVARSRLIAAQRDAVEAGRWLLAPPLLPLADPALAESWGLARARMLLLHSGPDRDQARELLGGIVTDSATAGRTAHLIEALVLCAIASWTAGEREAALASLGKALSLGWREGFCRVYLDEGETARAILRAGLGHPDWVGQPFFPYARELVSTL